MNSHEETRPVVEFEELSDDILDDVVGGAGGVAVVRHNKPSLLSIA